MKIFLALFLTGLSGTILAASRPGNQTLDGGKWISADKPENGWRENGFVAGEGWIPVRVIGNFGIKPWNKPGLG